MDQNQSWNRIPNIQFSQIKNRTDELDYTQTENGLFIYTDPYGRVNTPFKAVIRDQSKNLLIVQSGGNPDYLAYNEDGRDPEQYDIVTKSLNLISQLISRKDVYDEVKEGGPILPELDVIFIEGEIYGLLHIANQFKCHNVRDTPNTLLIDFNPGRQGIYVNFNLETQEPFKESFVDDLKTEIYYEKDANIVSSQIQQNALVTAKEIKEGIYPSLSEFLSSKGVQLATIEKEYLNNVMNIIVGSVGRIIYNDIL